MALQDVHFTCLFDAAVAARRHSIAIDIETALRAVNSAAHPSPEDNFLIREATDACALADQAVMDYRRGHY
jgi:hypothetical protein